jgi:carboxymethylenebutenolidase
MSSSPQLWDGAESGNLTAGVGEMIGALKAQTACTGGIGALGVGRGCSLVLAAASEALLDGAVFYWTEPVSQNFAAAAGIACPSVFHCPEGEGALPTGKIQTGRDDAELYLYPGAALSFAIPSGGNNDQPSAALAHSRSIALFRRVIGPHYDLVKLWEKHLSYEFETRDVEATMATMVAEPYVNHVPTMMGGVGKLKLSRFYRDHFIFSNPPDTRSVLLSRTVGADRVIDEMLHCFTHTTVVDWLLPGVPPTGRYVEIPPGRCNDLPRR